MTIFEDPQFWRVGFDMMLGAAIGIVGWEFGKHTSK